MPRSFARPALATCLALLPLLAAGCDDDDVTGSDAAASDGSGGPDAVPGPDAPTGPPAMIFTLSPTGPDRLYGVAYSAQGSLFAVGQIAATNDATADIATVVARFTPAGGLDTTFGGTGFVVRNIAPGTNGELFRGIVVQSTGKVVVSGQIEHAGAADARDRDIALARFNADGTPDTTFGTDGIVTLDLSTGVVNGNAFSTDSAWGLAAYADDRLVLSGGQVRTGGLDTDFVLVRLSADGVRDPGFGTNGVFALDTQFNNASNNASPRNLTILPGSDGIIGAGYQPIPPADTRPVVYKVTDAGQLDTTFGTNGVFSQSLLEEQTETYMVAVQPVVGGDYKLVTTGYGRQLSTETTDLVSLRLTSKGVIDPTWGPNGNGLVRLDIGGFGDNSRRLAVLPDGRVLLVGGGRLTSADVDGVVAILTQDGKPDLSFSPTGWKDINLGGPADFLWSLALSPDARTAAVVGIKGVGTMPSPATANDDAALLLLPLP